MRTLFLQKKLSNLIANNLPLSNNKIMIYRVEELTETVPTTITTRFKEHRAIQYYTSRKALLWCLAQQGIPAQIEHLDIVNHHHLANYPQILVSLAHTDCYGAAVIGQQHEYRSLGIDIELQSRLLKPETQKMFVNRDDDFDQLLPLWCQKEAAFKALSPLVPEMNLTKPLVLKDIWICNERFGLIPDQEIGKVKLLTLESLIVAIANI